MSKSTFSTVAVTLVIFVCGYVLGYLSADTADEVLETTRAQLSDMATVVADSVTSESGSSTDTTATPAAQATDTTAPSPSAASDVAFVIKVSDLPDAQQTMLRAAGIDGTEIVITKAMQSCAQTSIGVARTKEISEGAKPSIIEGAKFVTCYNQ